MRLSCSRLTTQSVNGTNTVAYSYDADDLLIGSGGLTIQRNAVNGLPTGASLGVVIETLSHNTFAELVQQDAITNGSSLYRATYTLDTLGRAAQKTETVQGVTNTFVYTYDVVGRVTAVTRNGTSVENYGYDANGNRVNATVAGVSVTATYDNQDRLMQYGSVQYTYNAAGQLVGTTNGVQTTAYEYDPLGNLLGVTLPNATANTYLLDGLDRRVGKKVNGAVVQRLLYAGDSPIAELDGLGAVTSRFIYIGGDSAPAMIVKNGVAHRVITDQIGSVRLVVNSVTGAVMQRMDYDSFGNVTLDSNPGFQPFGFAGGLYDSDTKLVRFGARDYDAQTGRWTAKDPIGFAGLDSNLYAYALNDPVNFFDPTGYGAFSDVVGSIFNSFLLSPLVDAQFSVLGGPGLLLTHVVFPQLGIDPMQMFSDALGLGVDTKSTAYIATDICIGVVEIVAGGVSAAKGLGAAREAAREAARLKQVAELAAKREAQIAEQNGKQFFKTALEQASQREAAARRAAERVTNQGAQNTENLGNMGTSGWKTGSQTGPKIR